MRRRRRRRRFRRGIANPARDSLGRVLDRYGVKRELREHRLLSHWGEIVGDRIAGKTWPDGLKDGVLWVRVVSSAWMHELTFIVDELRDRANQKLGADLVREVRLHLGTYRAAADDPLAPTLRIRRAPPRYRPLPSPARGARLAEIEAETDRVEDPELRRIILDARRKLNL